MQLEDKRKQKKFNKRFAIGSVLVACVVMFLSFYFLILPATTMVVEPICGNPDHLHTQECFEKEVTISFICGLDEHTHDESCYDEEGTLVCLRQEHTHTGHCMQAVAVEEDTESFIENLIHGDLTTDEVTLPETSVRDNAQPETNETVETVDVSENDLELLEVDGNFIDGVTDEMGNELDLLSSKAATRGALRASIPINFTNWITGVTLQVSYDGRNFMAYDPSTPMYSWQHIKFTLDYEIPGYTLSATNKSIYYQIPYNIVVDNIMTGKVFDKSGRIIGDYEIDTSGIITIEFYEEFALKNAQGSVVYGDISFQSDASKFETKKDGTVDFIFREDIVIEITIADKTDKRGDLFIEKSQSELSKDGFIEYTVKVYSNEGTSDIVKITDTMSNVIYYDRLTIRNSAGQTMQVMTPESGASTLYYELPKLNQNDYYLLTYRAKLASEFNSSTYLDNHVKASSKDSQGMEVEAVTSVSMFYSVNVVSKTGAIGPDGKIEWVISVNPDGVNIGGYTLKDFFNNSDFKREVELIGPNGSRMITLPYTFPENDTNSYVIKYKTGKEKIFGGNSSYNKVVLEKGDKQYYSEKYVYIGDESDNIFEKTGKDIVIDDNGNATLTWNLHLYFADTVPANTEISDFTSNGHYFTANQVRAFLRNIDSLHIPYTTVFYGENGWWPEYKELDENALYGSIRIRFTEAIPSGTELNFDYQTTAHIDDENKAINFNNKFSVGNTTTETGIEYEPDLKKYDPASSENPSTHDFTEDRIIKWAIKFDVPETKFDIREILPANTKLTKFELQGRTLEYETVGENEILVHFDDEFARRYAKTSQIINVEVQIDADFSWVRHSARLFTGTFTNKVLLEQDNEIKSHSEHTQIINKHENEEEYHVIDKKYNGVNLTDTLPYTLDVNPNAKDFSKDDFLTVADEMNYRGNSDVVLLYLAFDTVEAYEVLADGSTRKLTDDEFSFKYTYDISKAASAWGDCVNNLEFRIPDGMHVQINYIYKINGVEDSSAWHTFLNKAKVINTQNETEGDSIQTSISISRSAATATTGDIEVHKIDADTGRPIPDVYFRLYKYNGTNYELVTDENDNDLFKTDEKGCLVLKEIELNCAYYISEVLPPENYIKMDDYYFMMHEDDTELFPICKPDDFAGDTYRRGMDIQILNKKPVTKVSVRKIWTDGNGIVDGFTGDSAQINLYRTEQSDEEFQSGIGVDGIVKLTTKYIPNEWGVWDDLTTESQYLAGTRLRLVVKCFERWWAPEVVVKLNNQTLGGTKNGVYIQQDHGSWVENVLQYTEYTYDFTVSSKSDLIVNCNHSDESMWEFSYEVLEIPSGNNENSSSIAYKTIILTEENDWNYTWEDLPLVGTNSKGETIHYHYYIKEANVAGYISTVELVNETENSYEYTVTNRRTIPVNINMPATGGFGVYPIYIVGGALLLFALYKLFKIFKKR